VGVQKIEIKPRLRGSGAPRRSVASSSQLWKRHSVYLSHPALEGQLRL